MAHNSPVATFVQTVASLQANTAYTVKLQWKANTSDPYTIVAGAGSSPNFSPTRVTALCTPSSSSNLVSSVSSTQQYALTGSDGVTWHDIDASKLALSVTPSSNCSAIVAANADLFTNSYGYNQDIGIFVSGGIYGAGKVVAWEEAGGLATYMPIDTTAQTILPLQANTAYTVKLQWKANKSDSYTLYAGAGSSAPYSPTGLTVFCTPESNVWSAPTQLGPTITTYTSDDLPSTVTDGKGQVQTYTYDSLGRTTGIAYTNADGTSGGSILYSLDADGNTTSMTDATGVTGYQYNALNQQTLKTLPNSQTVTYSWDGVGNLLTQQDSNGTMVYTYTPDDQVATTTDPQSNKTTFGYDQDGNETTQAYPNGVTETMTYTAGELTKIADSGCTSGTCPSFTYSYTNPSTGKASGLLYSQTDASGNTTSYTYDAANELKQATEANGGTTVHSYAYQYDPAGNMTSLTRDSTTTPMTVNADNALTQAGSVTYAYDANGNETSTSAGASFTYNAQNQTTSVTGGGTTTPMTYTGVGEVERVGAGGTTYQYEATGIGASTNGGATTPLSRSPGGSLLSERVSGSTYYYLTDAQGSVVGLTDSSGRVVNSYSYDPIGASQGKSETVSNPYQYQGAMLDSSGLYQSGSGYYDPGTGQGSEAMPDLEDAIGGPLTDLTGLARGGRWGSYYYPRVYHRGEYCCREFADAGVRYSPHFGREVINEYLDFGIAEGQVLDIAQNRYQYPDQYIANEEEGYRGVCGQATVVYYIGDEPTAITLDVALVWNPQNEVMVTTFFAPECPPTDWIPIA